MEISKEMCRVSDVPLGDFFQYSGMKYRKIRTFAVGTMEHNCVDENLNFHLMSADARVSISDSFVKVTKEEVFQLLNIFKKVASQVIILEQGSFGDLYSKLAGVCEMLEKK